MNRPHAHEEVPRSEGDLHIYWDEQDGRIAAAWCQGTVYRGYEMILIGRYPEEMFGRTRFPPVGDLNYLLTLAPRGFFWFLLKQEDETRG